MPEFFGFNDDPDGHTTGGRQWQPSRLSPNVFRFSMYWNTGGAAAREWCDQMKLGSLPGHRAIVALYKPGEGAPSPTSTQFYDAVSDILEKTTWNTWVEVWNEPNNPDFGGLPSSKTRELIIAAVKADAGRNRLIGPAMTPALPNWGLYMLEAYADHLVPAAVHIYPQSHPWTADFDAAIKQANLANGIPVDPKKKIFITEMALRYWRNKQGVWELLYANYAEHARDAYIRTTWHSNVHVVIFHRLRLNPDDPAAQYLFDYNGRTFFLDKYTNNETELVDRLDEVR